GRYLFGGRADAGLPFLGMDTDYGFSYTHAFDDQSSVVDPGPGISPIQDDVSAFDTTWKIPNLFKAQAEAAFSQYNANVVTSTGNIGDTAWRFNTTTAAYFVTLNAGYRMVGTNFYSVGSPVFVRDRAGFETSAIANPFPWAQMSLQFNEYGDNLQNDPTKLTTTNDVLGGGVNLIPATWMQLSTGYNKSSFVGKDPLLLNNTTTSIPLALTLVWPTFGTSLSYSESNFRDVTTRSNDLDTTSINGGLNFLLFSSMALQVGGTQTTINNL